MTNIETADNDKAFHDLIDLFEQQTIRYGERPLYSYLDRNLQVTDTISFSQLYRDAVAFAAVLQSRGMEGQTVQLLYPSGPQFPVAFWGTLLAGACPVPVARPRGRDWQVMRLITQRANARCILGPSSLLARVPEHSIGCAQLIPHESIVTHSPDLNWAQRWRRPHSDPHATAMLQFTSGSTGSPKGVMLSHANILANLRRIHQLFRCSEKDIGLCWLPLHHDMGLIGHLLQPLYAGIHNYFMAPAHFLARPLLWLQAISQVKASISGAPCFAYSLCLHSQDSTDCGSLNLQSWRLAYCAAEIISADVLSGFSKRFQSAGFQSDALFPCYGLAEATLLVTGRHKVKEAIPPQSAHRRAWASLVVSVGPVGRQARVVDVKRGRVCDDGEVGEIWLQSPSVAAGYYNDNSASIETFQQKLSDGDVGFLRTGDLGMTLDGELYLIGRLKSLIKVRGVAVFPEQVERMVQKSISSAFVQRCAVIGVGEDGGESLGVLVELRRGIAEESAVHLSRDISKAVAEASGVAPAVVKTLRTGTLPLTTSGKVQRFACRHLIDC